MCHFLAPLYLWQHQNGSRAHVRRTFDTCTHTHNIAAPPHRVSTMSKQGSARNERTLNELRTSIPANNECADCGAPRPGWASWNLGVFLCVRCAQLHRALGTDISKVKSLSLDVWTKDQVDSMRVNGNARSNERYNPDQHPHPTDGDESERNSQMARFISKKYRDKAFAKRKSRRQEVDRLEEEISEMPRTRAPDGRPPTVDHVSSSRAQTPQSAALRIPSPVPMPVREPLSRSATAPVPQRAFISSASPSTLHASNPYQRQMTASVQPVSTQSFGGYNSGFAMPQLGNSWTAQTPQYAQSNAYQTVQPKGGVWDDLAGLSISSSVPSLGAAGPAYSGYPASAQSAMSSSNPFLRASPASSVPSSQSTPSHAPPGSFAPLQSITPLFSAPAPLEGISRNPFFASMQAPPLGVQSQPFGGNVQYPSPFQNPPYQLQAQSQYQHQFQ